MKSNLKYSSPLVLMLIAMGNNIKSGALVNVCARAEENTMQYFEINKKHRFCTEGNFSKPIKR